LENDLLLLHYYFRTMVGWLCDTVVECRSLNSELSLSCTRPTVNGWPLYVGKCCRSAS